MTLSTFFFLLIIGNFKNLGAIELQLPPNFEPMFFEIELDGDIWAADYSAAQILKFNKKGKLVLILASAGNGPGELSRPGFMHSFKDDTRLLIQNINRDIFIYDTNAPSYIKKLPNTRGFWCFSEWKENEFLLLFANHNLTTDLFVVVDSDGEIKKSWLDPTWRDTYYKEHSPANTFDSALVFEEKVYFAEPFQPFVWISKPGNSSPVKWELRKPKFFKEAPAPLPKEKAMIRHLNYEWLTSFSQLHIFSMRSDLMIADWTVHDSTPDILDIYELKTHKVIAGNIDAPGRVISVTGSSIYMLERVELDEEDKLLVHHIAWED